MADEGILKTLNVPSCIKEQREDSTLKDGTTLTPEHPEKSVTDKDLIYGNGLQLVEHVKSAFAFTLSPGGQESPTAVELDMVAQGSLEREVSLDTQLKSGAEADLMLLKTSNKNGLAQEQQEGTIWVDCFGADTSTPTLLSPEYPERSCLDNELLYKEKFLEMAEPSLGSAPRKEKSLYEAQERAVYPEDLVVELRTTEGRKLLLAEAE